MYYRLTGTEIAADIFFPDSLILRVFKGSPTVASALRRVGFAGMSVVAVHGRTMAVRCCDCSVGRSACASGNRDDGASTLVARLNQVT